MVGRAISRASGRRSGISSRSSVTPVRARARARAAMPGAEWFPGAELSYAEHVFRGKRGRRGRDRARVGAAAARRRCPGASCATLTGGDRAPASRARRRAGRPRRRATCRTSPRRSPRSSPARRSARSGRRARRTSARARRRPVRADRAEGAARRRRLPLRRHGLRPPDTVAELQAEIPTLERPFVLPYLGARGELGGAAAPRRRARVRAAAVRPSALGALLVRHDRAAEGDRARPGRDPARAPEDAAPPRRRARRRPAVLVHDDRLDDVELPARRAAHRGGDRPLRRQPGDAGPGRALGSRRAAGHHLLRHERRLHRRVHEGGRRAARRARPLAAPQRRLDRLAALAGGLPLGLRARRRRHLALLDERRHRRLHRVRRRRPDAAGLRGRAAGAARSARRSRPSTRTATRSSTRSASSS